MATKDRMDKTAFLKKLEGRSVDELRTLLWTAYWRGTAVTRERIEESLNPQEVIKQREVDAWVDPKECLREVTSFCARARAGDYMRGARDLGRKEVSGWRLTFRRLFDDSARLLQQPDTANEFRPLVHLLDFTHDLKDWNYFRTQDPVEAAKIVFSDRVETLWRSRIDHAGFGVFLKEAPAQLLAWESPGGWTRYDGSATEKQRPLTAVILRLLPGHDSVLAFVRNYLIALEAMGPRAATPQESKVRSSNPRYEWENACRHRSERLEHWHKALLERFVGSEDEPLIDRILTNRALDGPYTWHLLGRLRLQQGRRSEAKALVKRALDRLPGATSIQATALELASS